MIRTLIVTVLAVLAVADFAAHSARASDLSAESPTARPALAAAP